MGFEKIIHLCAANPSNRVILNQLSSVGLQPIDLLLHLIPAAGTAALAAFGLLSWRWGPGAFCTSATDHEKSNQHEFKNPVSPAVEIGVDIHGNEFSDKLLDRSAQEIKIDTKDPALVALCSAVLVCLAITAGISYLLPGYYDSPLSSVTAVAATCAFALLSTVSPARRYQVLAEVTRTWETLGVLAILTALTEGLKKLGILRVMVSAIIAGVEAVPTEARGLVAVISLLWTR
jgi:hypothetical protein